jgi:hypothetical protein
LPQDYIAALLAEPEAADDTTSAPDTEPEQETTT